MIYEGSNISRDAHRSRVENALDCVAAMVADRDDGDVYLPVFLRLEEELTALGDKESAIERAKRLAKARR
jgi:hypothetical protein